jgi:small subunit ribosomal protein S18
MKMFTYRKKICKFCENKKMGIDYKNPSMLRRFVTEQGKILPRRITGTCSLHQRELVTAIKRARNIALLPYTNDVKNA